MAEPQPWMNDPVIGEPATAEAGAAADAQPWMAHPVVETQQPENTAESAPVTAEGFAKQGGIGVAKGAIGVAGALGDIGDLAINAGRKLGSIAGISPEMMDTEEKILRDYGKYVPGVGALLGPSSADVRSTVEKVTGPFREAQNVPEHYAETLGEFLPAAIGGPEGIGARLVKQVALPAVVSETAGQATKGTAAEPYARAAAAVAGGVGPALLARDAAKAAPGLQEVKDAASAGYKSPEVAAVTFAPSEIEGVSNIITSDLNRSRLNDRLAPQTHAILEDLKTPVNGPAHTIEDVQTTRQLLGNVAGNFNNPTEQKAASQAITSLDKLMASFPQSRVASGDITKANATLENARGDYAAAKTAEKVQEKIRNADLQAASSHSGSNVDNAMRQKLRPLLTSKPQGRGLTPDEFQLIEDSVHGSPLGNALRAGGKMLGGGGGMGALHSAAVGGATGAAVGGLHGALLGVGAPVAGFALKKAGDAITRANANKIVNQILSRSPLAAALAAAAPPQPGRLAGINALPLANAAALPLRLPLAQGSQASGN